MTEFLKEQGISIGQQLSDNVISQVLERSGVTEYLQNPQCDRNSYSPNNWNNGNIHI